MSTYLKTNQITWNTWTRYHIKSKFYDVEGFKAGKAREREGLDALEIAGVGNVTGKSLLHLQCHFGLDTLAWAHRGAIVTGIDFSQEAIQTARTLATELNIPATFVQSDLYELPKNLTGQFDVVFTSHGVLGWLPHLDGWAQVVARFLKPGGVFYIIEAHPFALCFDDAQEGTTLRLRYPYFYGSEPLREEEDGSYAAPDAPIHSVIYIWFHTLAEIIGSLLRAGLRIEAFEEYPFAAWAMFPWMEQRPDGVWQLPGGKGDVPLMFSLRVTKDRAQM